MGKGALKYGGKSGILPRLRPIFKTPIIEPSEHQKAKEAEIEQGYAKDVPLPQKKGFKFHRKAEPKPIISVEERIRNTIENRRPVVDINELSDEEKWTYQVGEIRRNHLKDLYLKEYERLQKLNELENKRIEKEKAAINKKNQIALETDATKLTLPTIESYLHEPLMRHRTSEEQAILEEKRLLNRKVNELEYQERKATDLLDLYHAAGNYITTIEQLDKAIVDAFEIKLNKFDLAYQQVREKLSGFRDSVMVASENDNMILDAARGEINGKPGLDIVRDTIDGQIDKLRHEAELSMHRK